MNLIRNILLFMLCGTAVFFDVRFKRIPNFIICLGLILGFLYQCEIAGLEGVGIWFAGALLPIVLISPLFYFRMIGAGDIKLLSVLGCFLGIRGVLICIICSFVIGAIISLVVIIMNQNLFERFRFLANYILDLIRIKKWKPYDTVQAKGQVIYFSIPIALSLALYLGGVI